MAHKRPTTGTRTISDVQNQLDKIVNRVYRSETRVVVERVGVPVAGIVSAADLDRLEMLDEADREIWSIVDEMRQAFQDVPLEEIEREAGRTMTEVREETRAKHKRASAR